MNAPDSPSTLDPSALLSSADDWRRTAAAASEQGDWEKAAAALQMAETSYDSGLSMADDDGGDVHTPLAEGRALCTVLRSDMALRHWKLSDAEAHLDAAYQAFKKLEDGVIGAELWRVTARLAERRGRWLPALAAWKRVIKLTEGKDEFAVGDAWVRAAEVELIRGNPETADGFLSQAEMLARDVEDDLMRSRVMTVRAADLEARRQYDAAWEAWQDAEAIVRDPPGDYSGLLMLRMAGTAVWVRPKYAYKLLEGGYEALVEANHPDALGLAYHQLSVLALAERNAGAAAVAALGTRRSRGGFDDTSRPLLQQALERAGHGALSEEMADAEIEIDDDALEKALEATLARMEIAWSELEGDAALRSLCKKLRRKDRSKASVRVEDGWTVADSLAIVRHRATLTWDAPVATLATVKAVKPLVAPTPPPIPRRVAMPSVRPHVIAATPPPPRASSGPPARTAPRMLVFAFAGIVMLSALGMVAVAVMFGYLVR